jgi:PAS domain S-box-containing protein
MKNLLHTLQRNKIIVPLIIISMIIMAGLLYYIPYLTERNSIQIAQNNAEKLVTQIKTIRGYYTSEIVSKVKKITPDVKFNYDHRDKTDTIPLPATFVHNVGELFDTVDGVKFKLYSNYPFPNRKDRVLDEYQKDALEYVENNPSSSYVKKDTLDGKPVLRVAVADYLSAQGCVTCHNTRADTPKDDWKLGDIRGVFEVVTPLSKEFQANETLKNSILIYIIINFLVLIAYYLYISYRRESELVNENSDLLDEVDQKENELKKSLKTIDKYIITSNTDNKGIITSVSEAFCDISGYTKEELIGKPHSVVRHPDMDPDVYKELWLTITAGKIWQGDIKNLSKEGTSYWVKATISPSFDDDGNISGYMAIRQDISDSKKIQELNLTLEHKVEERTQELQEQKDELVSTLDNLQKTQKQLVESEKMAALGQLVAGVAHEVNTPLGAIKSSGYNIKESIGKTLDAMPKLFKTLTKEQEDIFFALLEKSTNEHKVLTTREERRLKKELQAELEELGFDSARELAGKFTKLQIFDNVSQYKDLIDSEHRDFVLNTAYLISDLISNTNNINIAVERANKIIFALKKFSRYDNSETMKKTDLQESIETVLTIYQNKIKQGTELIRDYDPALEEIDGYSEELAQVWTNLIHNALQAMDDKGTLTVMIKKEQDCQIVSIGDSGTGIPLDIQDKIFDPFFTTKPAGEGSGLGLDIIKKIVEKHNGQIYFESTIDVGTTFFVKLPINSESV